MKSFTLVEILIVLSIIAILIVSTSPIFRYFQREADLSDNTEEIVSILRLARTKTLASERSSQWGIYFSVPYQYTLFQGPDYASRDDSFDELYQLTGRVEIYEIDLTGGGTEVVFDRILGETDQDGKISLRLEDDTSKSKTISIQPSGQVTVGEETPPTGSSFQADSRHVHIDYSGRSIDTGSETITLTFEDPLTTEEIIISDYIGSGQIDWEGTINVGGEDQVIKIHTHRLNDPDTQFCIHRDRRYNSKVLEIDISGDVSGSLIEYSADGLNTITNSIYASEPVWQ